MSRNVQIVLLCEDKQHENFVRYFLKKMDRAKTIRITRVVRAPKGIGSAEQFVRSRFSEQLKLHRQGGHHASRVLVVMLDGDNHGVERRIQELDNACRDRGVPCRRSDEHVLVLVPTWRIETWLAYLGGGAVDEGRHDYPRLQRRGEWRPRVDKLAAMCRSRELREPIPPSLRAACKEYRRWSDSM